jgi:hypothetical protein
MRENHYQKKAAIREQQKFVKNMSKGEIGGKASAFETEYDFYFQNNQGMFVVQSQLKQVDLQKIRKSKDLKQMMKQVSDYKDMKEELTQED